MAEQKESSVLFSLKELMNLEQDRVREQQEEKKRREDDLVRARADADRKVREEDDARLRAIEEQQRQVDLRGREDQARLEAIRHAEVEKARVEAENAVRLETMSRQQEHERQLQALVQDKSKKRLKWVAGGSTLVLVLAVVGGGFAYKAQYDNTQRLTQQLGSLSGEREELVFKLQNAQSPEARRALEDQLSNMNSKIQDLEKQGGGAAKAPAPNRPRNPGNPANAGNRERPSAAPSKPCNCPPGDPICSCL